MIKYVIREGPYSAELIEARSVDYLPQDPDDPMEIVKEFEAVCWCAAQAVYKAHQDQEPYDMWACKEDKENGDEVCPHFEGLLTRTNPTDSS